MPEQQANDSAPWWDDRHRPRTSDVRNALEECSRQVAAWGLALPAIDPVVVDFGLGDFRRRGLIQYTVANEVAAGYCGKLLFVSDGQTCPAHRHAVKHETFFVMRGQVVMNIADQTRTLSPGKTLTVPTGVTHSFTGCGNALLLEVSMPSTAGDNYFLDLRIGDRGVV